MIGKIFMKDQEDEFIIDCQVLCKREMGMLKVIRVLKLGDEDSYIGNRTISEEDYFYVNYEDLVSIEGEDLKKYQEKHPEYFL